MKVKTGVRISALMLAGGAMALGMRAVVADGVPDQSPLFYSGFLYDNGVAVDGDRPLTVILWKGGVAEPAESPACSTGPAATSIRRGRFRMALNASCKAAVNANRNLYVEVVVGNTTMGREKLGASPYAIEAERAGAAAGDLARTIAQLETRLSALEGQMSDQRLKSLESSALGLTLSSLSAGETGNWATFANMCLTNLDSMLCMVAANRKCTSMGFKLGVFIGEGTAESGLRSIACLK